MLISLKSMLLEEHNENKLDREIRETISQWCTPPTASSLLYLLDYIINQKELPVNSEVIEGIEQCLHQVMVYEQVSLEELYNGALWRTEDQLVYPLNLT